MDKLRFLNLGPVEPEIISSIWEYSRIVTPVGPTLFAFRPKSPAFGRGGQERFDELVKIEELPKDIKPFRCYGPSTGAYLVPVGTAMFYLHLSGNTSKVEVEKAARVAVVKVLRKHGFQIEAKSNDIFFTVGGKRKKLGGTMFYRFGDWSVLAVNVLFEFDGALANKIYKFDSAKFTKKGDITDIGDIVGGLWEVNPDIKIDTVVGEVAQAVASRFDLELEGSNLTEEEVTRMGALSERLDNDDWRLYGKHPDIK